MEQGSTVSCTLVSRAFGLGVSAPSLDGVEDGTGDGGRGMEWASMASCTLVSRAFGLGVSAPSLDGVEDGTGDGGRGIEHAKLGSDGDTGSERDGGGVRVLMLKSSIGGGVDRASLGDGKDVDGSSESRERKYAAPSKSATSEGGVSTSATGSSLSCTEGEASDLKSLTGSCCVGSVVLFLASHSRLIRIAAVICLASSSPSLLASPESSSVTGVKTASDRSRSCSWTLRSFGGRRPRSRRAASRFSFEANVFGGTGIFEERFPGAERSGDGVRSLVVKRRSIAWDLEGWTVFELERECREYRFRMEK